MTYVFDIDGTICTKTDGDYTKAIPMRNRIDFINKLYDEGHKIIFLTARGMGRFSNDRSKAELQFYNLTKSQLESWGAKHHELFLGKPSGDIYVDDKGAKDVNFFRD